MRLIRSILLAPVILILAAVFAFIALVAGFIAGIEDDIRYAKKQHKKDGYKL